ncbi:MAG: FHA domain-containing protein [Chloroflexota bacterium]
MMCPNCKHWNEAGARFCEECGFELTDVDAAAQSQVSLAPATLVPAPPAASNSGVPDPAPQTLVPATDAAPAPVTYNGPRLVLGSTGSIFKLGDMTVIGREDPTLQIDFDGYPEGKYISHHHAQIRNTSGTFYIEDLGSSNHTWVNDIKLAPNQAEPLHDGDKVRMGKIELVFQSS